MLFQTNAYTQKGHNPRGQTAPSFAGRNYHITDLTLAAACQELGAAEEREPEQTLAYPPIRWELAAEWLEHGEGKSRPPVSQTHLL